MPEIVYRTNVARARALWCHLQLLDEPAKSPREALLRSGWLHAIGGADAYVSLWARCSNLTRAVVDDDIAAGHLWVAPGARGCTMLVPREELGLALLVGTRDARRRTESELRKVRVEMREIAALRQAIVEVLDGADAGLSTDELRQRLPDGAIRSLGEAGKKLGLSSTLPPTLRLLEADGVVGRRPADGRLDAERYRWHVHERDPLRSWSPGNAVVELASRYFRYAAPATVRGFAGWAGVGLRAATQAVETLGLEAIEIEGAAEPGFVSAAQLALLRDPPPAPALCFVPFRDNYTDFRLGLGALVDPACWSLAAPSWGSGASTLGAARHLLGRAVLAEGRIVGLWDYDAEQQRIVVGTFDALPRSAARAQAGRANALGVFVRDEVGHGLLHRSESRRSREARLAAVRAHA